VVSAIFLLPVWPKVAVGDRFWRFLHFERQTIASGTAWSPVEDRPTSDISISGLSETGSSFLASNEWVIDPYNLLKSNRNTWSTSRVPLCDKLTDACIVLICSFM